MSAILRSLRALGRGLLRGWNNAQHIQAEQAAWLPLAIEPTAALPTQRQDDFERAWCTELAELVPMTAAQVGAALADVRHDRQELLARLVLDGHGPFPKRFYPTN